MPPTTPGLNRTQHHTLSLDGSHLTSSNRPFSEQCASQPRMPLIIIHLSQLIAQGPRGKAPKAAASFFVGVPSAAGTSSVHISVILRLRQDLQTEVAHARL